MEVVERSLKYEKQHQINYVLDLDMLIVQAELAFDKSRIFTIKSVHHLAKTAAMLEHR